MDWSYPTRDLNEIFLISQSHDSFVNYSVDISATLSLTGGQAGTVYLEVADDDAFTTNVQEVCRTVNSNLGTLALGLAITQIATAQLSGMIPTYKWTRLRTQNNTGTPTFTFRSAQECVAV